VLCSCCAASWPPQQLLRSIQPVRRWGVALDGHCWWPTSAGWAADGTCWLVSKWQIRRLPLAFRIVLLVSGNMYFVHALSCHVLYSTVSCNWVPAQRDMAEEKSVPLNSFFRRRQGCNPDTVAVGRCSHVAESCCLSGLCKQASPLALLSVTGLC
jgi:hypothetical protein